MPITYFFYPETARRSLEDMDEIFRNERFGVTKCRKPGPKKTQDELDAEMDNYSGKGESTQADGYGGPGNTAHIGMTSTTTQ